MAREEQSGSSSDSESEEIEKVISEEEEEEERKGGISEYEKRRLSRIAENKARMEALGLHKMASSLAASVHMSTQRLKSSQRKGKNKLIDDDDDDYTPNDDDDQDDDDDDDEDFVGQSSSKSRKNNKPSKSKPNKKVPLQNNFSSDDYINEDDDDELMQAIALSLQDSVEDGSIKERKEKDNVQEDAGRRKRKKSLSNRVQMTEDELILHFFQFDEEGRGFLTVRDLQRQATAHDFTWTDRELADMIHYFDRDGDGKECVEILEFDTNSKFHVLLMEHQDCIWCSDARVLVYVCFSHLNLKDEARCAALWAPCGKPSHTREGK